MSGIVNMTAVAAIALGLAPPALPADLSATDVVDAAPLADPLPTSPADPAWDGIAARDIPIYPQHTVRLNDARANAARSATGAATVSVEAVASPTALAIRLEWADPTRDQLGRQETGEFGDAAAIEFPVRFGKGLRLPHIAMGDEKAPVRLYLQRAGDPRTLAGEFVASGFGSLTRATRPLAGTRMEMAYDAPAGRWRAVFSRPLAAPGHSLAQALVPAAFAVWDGARFERGGNKRLSGWKIIRLPGFKPDPAYVRELAAEYAPPAGGSARRGQQKVAALCAGCHQVGRAGTAPAGLAPDLSAIGGIATAGYLRASILRPSEVVVRNLQLNRHYDRTARPDAFRAYPHDEAFRWYVQGPGRQKTSKMPSFAGLPAQDIADIVAYLESLDGAPGAPATPAAPGAQEGE